MLIKEAVVDTARQILESWEKSDCKILSKYSANRKQSTEGQHAMAKHKTELLSSSVSRQEYYLK